MKQTLSLIIRAKNEARTIEKTINAYLEQTVTPSEIVLVDNNSTDATRDIAKKYKAKIVIIKDNFSHAYSCNAGAKAATGNLLLYTNAHSIPVSPTMVAEGMRHFADKKVATVTGDQLPPLDAGKFDKTLEDAYKKFFGAPQVVTYTKRTLMGRPGLLSTVNGIIRRDVWEEHPFDETLSFAEDTALAYHYISLGYNSVVDPGFSVYHYHKHPFLENVSRRIMYAKGYFAMYYAHPYSCRCGKR